MQIKFNQRQVSLAVAALVSATSLAYVPHVAAADKIPGKYAAGDFHNHTTCSDGSISMQKLVKKVTDKVDTPWGLDWFVQAGHGGNGNRNCTLAEDASLDTPAYPVTTQGPTTTWQSTVPPVQPKGLVSGTAPNQNMWRWQSIQEFQYPLVEYLATLKNLPLFVGIESVVAGHEHASMSVITGQMPAALDRASLPAGPVVAADTSRYAAIGNAHALAQWEYCFDRNDADTSRGNATVGSATGNNWNCSVPGSLNATDPSWSATAQKLMPASGTGSGDRGHLKTVEAMKWMAQNHADASYYIPAHLERAGPFNPNGNNGFNIEHLRNLNNAAPKIAFGMETQPGHGASSDRGEYKPLRQTINGVLTDSVGGTTYGGTGVYGAQIGGVWDAMLGEGRNFWFFASSDWHNRGSFGPDDRRSTQDFYPGEYQRNYTMVRNGTDKIRAQAVVDGLRTGNNFAASGQLIDRLAFIACVSYPGLGARSNSAVETLAVNAASSNTDINAVGCATMGEKLKIRAGGEVVVSIVVRDPEGSNYAPYTFANPALAQIGVNQPLNMPELDHIDLIRGMVTGYKTPGSADYAGQWPTNTAWLKADGTTTGLGTVPAGAKNTSTAILKTFSGAGTASLWSPAVAADGSKLLKMSYRIPAVAASQYLRLRGTNLPPAVPFETDANGNPLSDLYTNAADPTKLTIPCTTVGTNVPANGVNYTGTTIDGCPNHLPVRNGVKYLAYDVAAWSDLWFYSNPIFVEVSGSSVVAGVN
ncbi:MAG: hypothetical protein H7274_24630 [Rhodoferax sp.]|nr:hypothetical protein [Rhodoferax sp.]